MTRAASFASSWSRAAPNASSIPYASDASSWMMYAAAVVSNQTLEAVGAHSLVKFAQRVRQDAKADGVVHRDVGAVTESSRQRWIGEVRLFHTAVVGGEIRQFTHRIALDHLVPERPDEVRTRHEDPVGGLAAHDEQPHRTRLDANQRLLQQLPDGEGQQWHADDEEDDDRNSTHGLAAPAPYVASRRLLTARRWWRGTPYPCQIGEILPLY